MMARGLDPEQNEDRAVPDRFHCPDLDPDRPSACLVGDEAHHLTRVLRAGPGTAVELFDGRGRAVAAVVTAVARDRVDLAVVAPLPDRDAPIALTLAVAPPKGDRLDWLVEKATEIGVARLVPLRTERSEVDPRPTKLDRLRRRIVEASKQCGRARLMDLDPPRTLADLLDDDHGNAIRMIAHPDGLAPHSWPRPNLVASSPPVVVAIGPEGGFGAGELAAALSRGWTSIGLGPTLLRVETAALAAATLVLLGPSSSSPAHTNTDTIRNTGSGDETRHA
jgi:16S rRNA (uracil1498-N3)-methyltransferase